MNKLIHKAIAFHLRLVRAESGVAVTEYGLLVALISVGMLVALKALGVSMQSFFTYISDTLTALAGS